MMRFTLRHGKRARTVQSLAFASARRTIGPVKAFAAGLAITCLGCASAPPGAVITHMDSVDVVSGGVPFRVFPEMPGTQDSLSSASWVMPSESAPPCARIAPAPESWPVTRAATPSRYLAAVSLRLPRRFALSQSDYTTADAERFGGISIAVWHDTAGSGPNGFPNRATVGIWVDAEAGYPTIGTDTASRQLSIEECIAAEPAVGTRLVKFEVDTPEGRQTLVGAVWPIGPDRYLRLLGSTPNPTDVDTLLRALGSIRVERR